MLSSSHTRVDRNYKNGQKGKGEMDPFSCLGFMCIALYLDNSLTDMIMNIGVSRIGTFTEIGLAYLLV